MLNDIEVIQLDSILKYYKNCLDEENSKYFAVCSGNFCSSISVNQGIECIKTLEIKEHRKISSPLGAECEIIVDCGKLTLTEKSGLEFSFPSIEAKNITNQKIMNTANSIFEKYWHMDELVRKSTIERK